METNKTKYYKTNRLKSVTFYGSIFLPVFIIFTTIVLLQDLKNNWLIFLIFYPMLIALAFFTIKYWKTEITTDDNEIIIKRGGKTQEARWTDIVEFTELLFGSGETTFILKSKNGQKIGFSSSIGNYGELIKEIENYTGLKLKQRL